MKAWNPLLRAGFAVHGLMSAHPRSVHSDVSSTPSLSSTALLAILPPLPENSRRVYLLRHGETDWNSRGLMQGGGFDVELNESGKGQALAAADLLEGLPIDLVASSHLSRSEETADVISKRFPGAVRIVSHKFGEMRFGDFEGLALHGPESTEATRERFSAYNQLMLTDKSVPWPGFTGESVADVEKRAETGMHQLLRDFPECEHLCIVAHGRFNKIFLRSVLPPSSDLMSLQQGNACLNVLDIDSVGNWMARTLNFVNHVDRLKGQESLS